MSSFRVRTLSGFSDPSLSSERWQALLAKGVTDVVFLSWHWMRAWWESYHVKGDLLLVAAERRGEIFAIAPLISIEGNIMFLGSGESDYLDFVGAPEEPAVVAAMLEAARERAPDFCGFEFALVPEHSPTKRFLAAAAEQCGLELCLREEMPAVEVELDKHADEVRAAISRSMFQREEYYRRRGPLVGSAFLETERQGLRAVVCLKASDGKVLWKTPMKFDPWAGPVVVGKQVIVGCSSIRFDPTKTGAARGEILALDLETGAIQWRRELAAGVLSRAAVQGGLAIFTATDGRVRAYFGEAAGDIKNGGDADAFLTGLQYCRLHLAVQMLGWSPTWRPHWSHAMPTTGSAKPFSLATNCRSAEWLSEYFT